MSLFTFRSIHQGLDPERFSDESRGRREINLFIPTGIPNSLSERLFFAKRVYNLVARSTWTAHGLNELQNRMSHISFLQFMNTAISRKVVEKGARDNSEGYCGWFWVHCSSKKFQRMTPEAMDACLRLLKENNKSRFDSCSVRTYPILPFEIVTCTRNSRIQGWEATSLTLS